MSLFSRRSLLANGASVLALSGCQFTPAFQEGGPASALFGQIEIQEPGNERSYLMTRRLEERLGRGGPTAPYRLNFRLNVERINLGTDREGSEQRVHIIGRVRYSLLPRTGNSPITRGEVHNFTGYSTTGNTVSTRAANIDAIERLVVILADDIIERLLLASPTLDL